MLPVMNAGCCAHDPQERRGWLIVLVAFLADALGLGGRGLFSFMILYFEAEFGWDRSTSSALKALVHVMIALATIASGQIADSVPAIYSLGGGLIYLAVCYGAVAALQEAWHAWLVYGVMCGIAWGGLNLNVFSVCVMRTIPARHHGLAVGIATAGSTFGMFALVPFISFIAESVGWRAGYICMSISTAVVCIPAICLLRAQEAADGGRASLCCGLTRRSAARTSTSEVGAPAPAQSHESSTMKSDGPAPAVADGGGEMPPSLRSKLRTLVGSRAIWLLSLAFVVCGVTTTGFVETHVVALAVERGESVQTGAFAFSVLSACNGLGMLIAGWLSDRVSRSLTLSLIFAVRGLSFLLLLWNNSQAALFAFAVIFGLVDYSVVPPVVSLVGSHAGQHTVGLGVGILLAWHSLAAAGGSYFGGVIYEATSNYNMALEACAGICFIAAVAVLGVCPEPLLRRPHGPLPSAVDKLPSLDTASAVDSVEVERT